jgi:acyl carrier protein
MTPRSLSLVYQAVDSVNASAEQNKQIAKDPSTPLLDSEGGIDSLALVNLVVALEQIVFDATEKSITIADEDVYSSPDSPFRTLGSLAAYLDKMID